MKKQNWQVAFWNVVTEKNWTPFEWGVHDCATFAESVIAAISDRQIDAVPRWSNEEAAQTLIALSGGLEALVTRHLGQSVNWGQCGMGDIVLCNLPNGPALAVHDGTKLVAPGPTGLRRIPFELAVCGWVV